MKNYEHTDRFGDKLTIRDHSECSTPMVSINVEGVNGSTRNVVLPHSKAAEAALALLEMCGQGVPEVEEYTTYYFTHTRNGRTQEVNGVHRVEFKRHFVLFYDEKGILILAERQEYVTELRQDVAA